jgi:catechol 2,3-dioxygenase-like lactoylglutathione lyase family enzyme
MSLAAQKDLLASAQGNEQFSGKALGELNGIEQGREFVTAAHGRLSLKELMEILACCDQPTVNRLLSGGEWGRDFLETVPAGYVVLENNAILHTPDMDATVRWFEDTLGWHGGVDARDDAGRGTYGCLLPDNPRAVSRATRVFEGIHMFRGEPARNALVFIRVSGLDALRRFVLDSGCTKVDEIHEEPWGAQVCHVETPEGYVLKFFETI